MRLYFILFFFSVGLLQAQDISDSFTHIEGKNYITLSTYKKTGLLLTAKDSSNFLIRERDTLVLLTNPEPTSKTVSVPYEYKDEKFLDLYKQVVFNSNNPKKKSKTYMRYWKEPIKLYVHNTIPESHQSNLVAFTNFISENVDSLNIRQVSTPEESNFIVYYTKNDTDKDFEPKINDNISGYYVNWNGNNQIYKAVVKVNTMNLTTEAFQLLHLKHNFFRALGHFNSSKDLPCSDYFANCKTMKEFSENDLSLLKYHYSYGICKGSNLETFENQHKFFKALLKEDNVGLRVSHTTSK